MDSGLSEIDKLGNKLEGILRKYLNCGYGDFEVKSNDNLTMLNWRSPIFFALGDKYGKSNNDPKVKETIDNFLEIFTSNSINDIVKNFEYYNLNSTKEAYQKIEDIINELEKVLK